MSETATLKKSKVGPTAGNTAKDQPQLKVFLVGMMGSGKSYWGEKLKKKLKVPAYELDALIEMMEERTISEIFAEDGEEYFRKEEAKLLRWFKEKKQFILSCGGGTPCFGDNMQWMNKNGITIFIDEPVEVLAERLSKEKDHRPLIKDLNNDQLKEFLSKKLEQRSEYYSQAKHTLSGDQLTESGFTKLLKEYA